ncbi:hypothetical protein V8G54_002018 [Vigna mungo]|uniref:Uncharacterized protein n=1 Tax=Vigna mungo TaxID=3915 RepID=A0AAQ3P8V7_VIGMU
MKGDCYNELVEVFYYNDKEVDGNIHSLVKGVDIVIDDDMWWKITELRIDGVLSHKFDCPRYKKIRKNEMFKSFMRIQTNWVVAFKEHILEVGTCGWHRLPYGVFISKVLERCDVNLTGENKQTCGKENMIGKDNLTCIGMKRTPQGWLFCDDEDSLKGKETSVNHDSDQEFGSPKSQFEIRVNDRFKRTSERINDFNKSLITKKCEDVDNTNSISL